MLTRVIHEMLITGVLNIETRLKLVHPKEKSPRPRAYVKTGLVPEHSELYDRFFLDLFHASGPMWMTELILLAHDKLGHDSENFKARFVKPALIGKKYLNSFSRPTSEVRKWVDEIRTALVNVESHLQQAIHPVVLANLLNSLGTNVILLNPETRKKIGRDLPEIQSAVASLKDTYDFSAGYLFSGAAFSSDFSFSDAVSFDGFGGGDFGGGGVDGDW